MHLRCWPPDNVGGVGSTINQRVGLKLDFTTRFSSCSVLAVADAAQRTSDAHAPKPQKESIGGGQSHEQRHTSVDLQRRSADPWHGLSRSQNASELLFVVSPSSDLLLLRLLITLH